MHTPFNQTLYLAIQIATNIEKLLPFVGVHIQIYRKVILMSGEGFDVYFCALTNLFRKQVSYNHEHQENNPVSK